ncbi:MAG: PIN domain-containing protein [Ruminococcus sp.]|jgi:predicted nucleic acid-binding protein|nr:PIN domain-containing protein [Ruminococcus sp.]
MKSTVLLIDSDVLIDYLTKRESFYENAKKIVDLCDNRLCKGVISSQCIANIFYILRQQYSFKERKALLRSLCTLFSICSVSGDIIVDALEDTSFSDFEDCVQMHCAISANADFIITRNTKDFANSKIKAITPSEFLELVS